MTSDLPHTVSQHFLRNLRISNYLGWFLLSGNLENPFEKDQRLLILLRASEEIFCDHFDGIHVDPGTIGKS